MKNINFFDENSAIDMVGIGDGDVARISNLTHFGRTTLHSLVAIVNLNDPDWKTILDAVNNGKEYALTGDLETMLNQIKGANKITIKFTWKYNSRNIYR